jgi:hypothetical protein
MAWDLPNIMAEFGARQAAVRRPALLIVLCGVELVPRVAPRDWPAHRDRVLGQLDQWLAALDRRGR